MADEETKTLLVTKENGKEFRITIPKDARTTFGPWSPPTGNSRFSGEQKALTGTLRVYKAGSKATEDIIAVFSGVASFRDMNVNYEEKVEEVVGAVVWRSDKDGYSREDKVRNRESWGEPNEDPLVLDVAVPGPHSNGKS